MTYDEIPLLGKYQRVLVTGPQRSGTQIAGRVIARILGYEFQNWKTWPAGLHGLMDFLAAERVVWQNPSMVGAVPFLRSNSFRVAVVFVWRDLAEINASLKRIGWTAEEEERFFLCMPDDNYTPSTIRKQHLWQTWEHRDACLFTLPYEVLEPAPEWVERPDRGGWRSDQWRAEQ